MENKIKQEYERMIQLKELYESIGVAGKMGLLFINPVINRYNSGEISKDLLNEMQEIEG